MKQGYREGDMATGKRAMEEERLIKNEGEKYIN
jgi:hypothetical protein